jgi:hypothetical protein
VLNRWKSTFEGYHFLGHSLVAWASKKQKDVALSMVKVEYIAARVCCAQILYMKSSLLDFVESTSCNTPGVKHALGIANHVHNNHHA